MQETEYAKALFEMTSNNSLMLEEFQAFVEMLKIEDFNLTLKAPNIKKENKKNILKEVLKKFDTLFVQFLYVVIDNNRINDILTIYDEYYKMVLKSENMQLVDIYLSKDISSNEMDSIKEKLENKLLKKVVINKHIMPNLIGGMRIEYDGKSIDNSVLNEFTKIKSLL